MKARSVAYWVTTVLFALGMGVSGIADLVHAPALVEGFGQLGYPVYLLTLLGVWKMLGGVAILAPRFPRLKEWAYAGFFFELTGAAFSHVASNDPSFAPPLVLLAIGMASWALRPQDRMFGTLALPSTPVLTPAAS